MKSYPIIFHDGSHRYVFWFCKSDVTSAEWMDVHITYDQEMFMRASVPIGDDSILWDWNQNLVVNMSNKAIVFCEKLLKNKAFL